MITLPFYAKGCAVNGFAFPLVFTPDCYLELDGVLPESMREFARSTGSKRVIIDYSQRDLYVLQTAAFAYIHAHGADNRLALGEGVSGAPTLEVPVARGGMPPRKSVDLDCDSDEIPEDCCETYDYKGLFGLIFEKNLKGGDKSGENIAARQLNFSGMGNLLMICDDKAPAEALLSSLHTADKDSIVILAADFSKLSARTKKRLCADLGFEIPKVMPKPFDAEYYSGLLKSLLLEEGISVKGELKGAVSKVMKFSGDAFDGTDIFEYAYKALDSDTREFSAADLLSYLGIEEDGAALDAINATIGCESAKKALNSIIITEAFNEARAADGKKFRNYKHMIFSGNPGTGKTRMAELTAKALCQAGVGNGRFTALGKDDLVGKFVGHTVPKTREALEKGRGGVIFIDEVSTFLTAEKSDSFAAEAVTEIVKFTEQSPETCVIFATYPDEAERFLSLDPGLRSRIVYKVEFSDYSVDELVAIFGEMAREQSFTPEDGCDEVLRDYFSAAKEADGASFGNARSARTLFERSVTKLAQRWAADKSADRDTLTVSDISAAADELLPNTHSKKRKIGF